MVPLARPDLLANPCSKHLPSQIRSQSLARRDHRDHRDFPGAMECPERMATTGKTASGASKVTVERLASRVRQARKENWAQPVHPALKACLANRELKGNEDFQ